MQRLRNGGIVVKYYDIANIYEIMLPYPHEDLRGNDWVNSEILADIPLRGPDPGFKVGRSIGPCSKNLSSDDQCLYDF